MISLLPAELLDTALFIMMAVGVLTIIGGYLAKIVPVVKPYAIFIQLLGILIFASSLYVVGGVATEKDWRQRVAELEAKMAKAEAAAANKNVEIQEKVVEKTKVIREKGQTQIEYITKIEKGDTVTIVKDMSEEERKKFQSQIDELKKFNETCVIPTMIIEQHNKATQRHEGSSK